MDVDIEFGELEHVEPETQLRPDRNCHFCSVPVAAPGEEDLPVFVELDVMREMEEHALSETRVELGGVMLGGQYCDREGRPFVVVTDSLRARHYESTKGSFKFTHDTWAQLTRQREQFPDETQMVGWYHTHPDWGVFLSGMDTFICDHFFNRPLDLALVIDPCRQERAFFQWRRADGQQLQRTGGFYLVASRFREAELLDYAAYLGGDDPMSGDPRLRGAGPPAPVVNIADGRQTWLLLALCGLLAIQFCFLALIAWRMLSPPAASPPAADAPQLAALQETIDALLEARRQRAQIDAKLQVLDEVVGQLGGETNGLVRSLAEKSQQVEELRASVRGQQSLTQELDAMIARLKDELAQAQLRGEHQEEELERLQAALTGALHSNTLQRERIALLEERDDGQGPSSPTEEPAVRWWPWNRTWVALAAAVIVLAVAGSLAVLLRWKKGVLPEDPTSQEDAEATNNQ